MKKSKIFFILAAIFLIITIGLFKYHNSVDEKYDKFLRNELSDLNFEHSIGEITDDEYKEKMDYWNEIGDNGRKIGTWAKISLGMTGVLYIAGAIIQFMNNKEKKSRILVVVVSLIILIVAVGFIPMIMH